MQSFEAGMILQTCGAVTSMGFPWAEAYIREWTDVFELGQFQGETSEMNPQQPVQPVVRKTGPQCN
jgi:hypothetical protein